MENEYRWMRWDGQGRSRPHLAGLQNIYFLRQYSSNADVHGYTNRLYFSLKERPFSGPARDAEASRAVDTMEREFLSLLSLMKEDFWLTFIPDTAPGSDPRNNASLADVARRISARLPQAHFVEILRTTRMQEKHELGMPGTACEAWEKVDADLHEFNRAIILARLIRTGSRMAAALSILSSMVSPACRTAGVAWAMEFPANYLKKAAE